MIHKQNVGILSIWAGEYIGKICFHLEYFDFNVFTPLAEVTPLAGSTFSTLCPKLKVVI